MEQFDQALLTFSQWSETVLSNLFSASQVNITNLQSASNEVNVRTTVNQDATPCRDSFVLIFYQMLLTGDPAGITEAVWCEAESGAAN